MPNHQPECPRTLVSWKDGYLRRAYFSHLSLTSSARLKAETLKRRSTSLLILSCRHCLIQLPNRIIPIAISFQPLESKGVDTRTDWLRDNDSSSHTQVGEENGTSCLMSKTVANDLVGFYTHRGLFNAVLKKCVVPATIMPKHRAVRSSPLYKPQNFPSGTWAFPGLRLWKGALRKRGCEKHELSTLFPLIPYARTFLFGFAGISNSYRHAQSHQADAASLPLRSPCDTCSHNRPSKQRWIRFA